MSQANTTAIQLKPTLPPRPPPKRPLSMGASPEDFRWRDEFLTPEDFARLLKVSRAMFFKMKSKGKVPYPDYFGRLPRWWWPDVQDWFRAGRPHADEWERIKARRRAEPA